MERTLQMDPTKISPPSGSLCAILQVDPPSGSFQMDLLIKDFQITGDFADPEAASPW